MTIDQIVVTITTIFWSSPMSFLRQSTLMLFTVATIALSVSGCIGSKITQANYDKIATGVTGMNVEKVKEVMGEPTEQNSGGIGIGGVGINGRTMIWKDGNRSISVIFLNDQAISKSQNGI
jgi:hypothetical protein